MSILPRGHVFVVAVLMGTAALLASLPALAQADAQIRLRDARLDPDGSTRLIVGLDGIGAEQLEDEDFQVFENGQEIEGLTAEPVVDGGSEQEAIAAMLVLDTSGSMRGEPIERIRTAASEAARTLTEQGIPVGIVSFSTTPTLLSDLTLDADTLVAQIQTIEADGYTALHDAVILSVEAIGDFDGLRTLVVFADGDDNRSESTITQAISAANQADVALTMVVLESETFDPSSLEQLALQTGGRLTTAAEADDLEGAFEEVAEDIANQYVITYNSDVLEPAELPVSVVANTPEGELRVDSLAINNRVGALIDPPGPSPTALTEPTFGFLATSTGLWLGIATAFLATLGLLWVVLVSTRRSAAARNLERGLETYGRGDRKPRSGVDFSLPTSRFTERAIDLVGRVPKPKGFDQRLQLKLDRAAWPMRSNEFLVLSIATGLLGGLVVGGLTGNLIVGVLAAVTTALLPLLAMNFRIGRRRAAFVDQLPSTLQLLAGSLRAGYSLMQALDTVVKEADDPTSTEFGRVLTEARLGMPLEEALEGMAQRLESEDFHWVVLAIGIQREVGGNLAELLASVAGTMRERATLRRQIRVLSAEGRISAWIVGLMPFFVMFALQVLNPGYLAELFTRIEGWVMLGAGAILLLMGMLWLRKIVDIEV